MKTYENLSPKIVHQGVDTLLTNHVILNHDSYLKYEKMLRVLENAKDEAKHHNANFEFESGISFNFYTFGKFMISPKGISRYKYVISNDDITIKFSTVKFGANDYDTPQISVEYRSKYLSLLGHEKAYSTVIAMFENLLATNEGANLFKSQLMRIDLCTDIMNIDFTPMDKFRFQTTFKNNGHIEFIEHMQYNRLTGFSFGKGDYMMRIYDKRLELNNNASKLWLTRLWTSNGYPQNNNNPVWRIETQMRRPYLKGFKNGAVNDEVLYFFNMLPNLWTFSFNKVNYVNIPNDNVVKIMEGYYTPENLKKLFQKHKKENPSELWELASTFKGIQAPSPHYYGNYKGSDIKVAKRFYKAFISSAYKSSNADPYSVINIMDIVSEELQRESGTSLHDYGENKVLSSFLDNHQTISNHGFTVDYDFRNSAIKMYEQMRERFLNLGDPLFERNEYRLAKILNINIQDLRDADLNQIFLEAFEEQRREITPIYEMDYLDV